MCLADAWWAEQQDVGRLSHEGHRGELAHLPLVDAGLKREVELVQRALEREVGEVRARAQVALASRAGLDAEQVGQEVGVADLLLGSVVEPTLEHCRGLGQPELLEVLVRLCQRHHLVPTSASAS